MVECFVFLRPLGLRLFLFSLAGVPPTAGFIGKLYIFNAAMGAQLYGLAVVGVLTSIMGAYYYLRVILYMYFLPAKVEGEALASPSLSVALAAAVAAVVLFGIVADPVVRLAQAASVLGM